MKEKHTDKIAGKLAKMMLSLQERFAVMMQMVVAKLSLHQLKLLLILCCIITGGYSLWLMIEGVFYPEKMKVMKVDKMKVPVQIEKDVDDIKADEELLKRIERRQQVMDSMGIKVSPSLADSIKILKLKL